MYWFNDFTDAVTYEFECASRPPFSVRLLAHTSCGWKETQLCHPCRVSPVIRSSHSLTLHKLSHYFLLLFSFSWSLDAFAILSAFSLNNEVHFTVSALMFSPFFLQKDGEEIGVQDPVKYHQKTGKNPKTVLLHWETHPT